MSLEMQTAQHEELYERLAKPVRQVERWAVRRAARDVSALQNAASDISDSLRRLCAIDLPELVVTQHETEDGAVYLPEDPEAEQEGLNTLLETARRLRRKLTGSPLAVLLRTRLPRHNSVLAADYEAALQDALERLAQIERLLVLYGAGTDDDAPLAEDLVPEARDIRGPSVPFEH